MLFSADQLRESIRLIDCDHDPVCHGYRWEIGNEAGLAELVGWTMQGHYRHAQGVLSQLAPRSLATRLTVQQQAVRRLELPRGTAGERTRAMAS